MRQVSIAGSTAHLLGLRFHPRIRALLVIDFGGAKVFDVDPVTGASTVFMTTASAAPEWPASMGDQNLIRPFKILTAFWQVMQRGATQHQADIIVIDVGPNLGAINRSALIASNHVVIPLGPDLFSLQGLRNLGPTLLSWRALWRKRLENWRNPSFPLPQGEMKPLGYLAQQFEIQPCFLTMLGPDRNR